MDAPVPLIEIKSATVRRGDNTVFNDLNLTLHQHESVAILGPNGAGKTTLLKLLTRDLYPLWREEPVVRILGNASGDIWSLRKQLGIISNDLQEHYSPEVVGEQVILSGGQQRRLILGRALINEPANLILDEPTTGLDLAATFAYLQTMRGLIRSGRTLVLVTHHIHEIPPEVSRVVLMSKGKVWADGPKREVLTEARLSGLYGVKVALVEASGWYQAVPAD
ncbi:MAG: ATP-binding cassette domain-containing protein [Gammaproteobacteria bacterium]|nr:ATP-binding cassette domain-containing protein [Gammaproteobacteria bacterium]